ncbi:substrate-binding periplasmic protein [Cellulomonas sp. P22]|uniref:substrate-binding periplasmic protein n=1 Tax=Cellulomonas sp. P22 TaxID=3373189 RepID=UPI0037BE4CCB
MTWLTTIVSTVAAVVGVVLAWPAFADWRRDRTATAVAAAPTPDVSVLESIRERRVIRVGCIPFPPLMSCSPGTGSADGLYALVLEDVAARLGFAVEYVPLRNDTAMDRLLDGKVDLVACLLETPERVKLASFTSRIHQMAICGVVRRDSTRISSQTDLRKPDVRAVVAEGEIGAEVARRHFGMSTDNGRLHEIVTSDVSSIFGQVLSRHADVAITDGLTCLDYLDANPDMSELLMIRFTEEPLWLVPCGLMIRQGQDDLAALLEDEVRRSLSDPRIEAANAAITTRSRNVIREM